MRAVDAAFSDIKRETKQTRMHPPENKYLNFSIE